MAKERITVEMGAREWHRLFYTGVVKSLAKSITEPITNSDSSYKRLHGLPDDSGLISAALRLKKGDKFDLSQSKTALKGKTPLRELELHIYTAAGHGRNPRTCDIVDFAEGMSNDEATRAFKEYAADKSAVSKGRPGRSLFGRGVSDVLFGHKAGKLYTYKDSVLTTAEFAFDTATKRKPEFEITTKRNPTASELRDVHLKKGSNGTCARFELADECSIPDPGNFVPLLSQFYMLRLINSDPNISFKIFQYRAKETMQDVVDYDFPVGDVIDRFSFTIPGPVPGVELSPVIVEALVARSESKGGLPGRELGELRANGLLIVDEKDAVLDQTLLPDWENVPYLKGIYGIVRVENARAVFEWYLNNGKDSPLTVSRDGFETRHEFTKLLFGEIGKRIEPTYRLEEQRFQKGQEHSLSPKAQKRMTDVIKVLNQFLDNTGESHGTKGKKPEEALDLKKPLQFVPDKLRLYVASGKKIKLFLKKDIANKKSAIVVQSDNSRIQLSPSSFQISDGKEYGHYLIFELMVNCDVLHESGKIDALMEDTNKQLLEARASVIDVIAQPIIVPPTDLAFRPEEATGQPSRLNNLILWVNPISIPFGRKIKIRLESSKGKIVLLKETKGVTDLEILFEKKHIIPDANVGRILVPWKGTGWGQRAKAIAETKRPDGTLVKAEVRMFVEQPEEDIGMVKRWEYEPLENMVCSQFADGVIWINSVHNLNKTVFGSNKPDFIKSTESDKTAQYRLASLVVEQAVFSRAEKMYIENDVQINERAPVTSMRETIDSLTHKLAPQVVKILQG